MDQRQSIGVAVVGSGGAGALTAGNLLLEAAGAAGWQGLLTRSGGSQIRGGEAAALLRVANRPLGWSADTRRRGGGAAAAGNPTDRMHGRTLRCPDRHRLAQRPALRRRDR